MNKYNEKNTICTANADAQLPEILEEGKFYKLLPDSKWDNERLELWNKCNTYITPPINPHTWKNRYLNPSSIPKNNFHFITKIMEEELISSLVKYRKVFIEKIEAKKKAITNLEAKVECEEKSLLELTNILESYYKKNGN